MFYANRDRVDRTSVLGLEWRLGLDLKERITSCCLCAPLQPTPLANSFVIIFRYLLYSFPFLIHGRTIKIKEILKGKHFDKLMTSYLVTYLLTYLLHGAESFLRIFWHLAQNCRGLKMTSL